jgi:hypothetical protein
LPQETTLNWRDGFAAQLWLQQRLTSHLSVGVGAGDDHDCDILLLGAGYKF